MVTVINNLINGNLKDARKGAARFQFTYVRAVLEQLGWSKRKAHLAALYLKRGTHWQQYCDAD